MPGLALEQPSSQLSLQHQVGAKFPRTSDKHGHTHACGVGTVAVLYNPVSTSMDWLNGTPTYTGSIYHCMQGINTPNGSKGRYQNSSSWSESDDPVVKVRSQNHHTRTLILREDNTQGGSYVVQALLR